MLLYNQVGKGTYWRALYLARGIAKQNHEVTLLATSKSNRLQFRQRSESQPGVTIFESPDLLFGPLRSGWDPLNVLARIRWLRHKRYDLIHSFESRPVNILPAIYQQNNTQAKLVLDWCDWFGRGGSVEERPNWLIRTVLRPIETFFENNFRTRAEGTTVINSFLKERAISLGVESESILILPNGSDTQLLRPIPKDEAREKLGLSTDIPVIGYIGAIFKRDAQLMAQAFDLVWRMDSKAKLLIVGYCNIAIEELVQEPQAILRTGQIQYEQISLYLSACDICWLPLNNSGANRGRFPLKLNDYMAVGKPVVVTAIEDIANLVQQGDFGLVTDFNPEDIAQKTGRLINNPELLESMGRRARQLAEEEYTWDQMGANLGRFYQRLTETRDN